MCLERCFNSLPVKHGRNEEWREGVCGENPGELKAEIERLQKENAELKDRTKRLQWYRKGKGN